MQTQYVLSTFVFFWLWMLNSFFCPHKIQSFRVSINSQTDGTSVMSITGGEGKNMFHMIWISWSLVFLDISYKTREFVSENSILLSSNIFKKVNIFYWSWPFKGLKTTNWGEWGWSQLIYWVVLRNQREQRNHMSLMEACTTFNSPHWPRPSSQVWTLPYALDKSQWPTGMMTKWLLPTDFFLVVDIAFFQVEHWSHW